MFDNLTEIFSKSKEKDIINGILGFFTMLLTNISRQPSINYILSHPSLASLQLTKFGNMGNEVADYYINFLKVLSRKITVNNLQLFFNKRYSSFPILSQTVRFFNHP
jgi:protein CLEC16A